MLPISLKISGIYSYQEEQTIDFAALTSAGLFGIFGAVGSGKSSILEAITLSLYGQIERLNSKGRSYNLLNLRSNKAYIEFVFSFENETYKFETSWKRNSKNFADTNKIDRKAYKKTQEEWEPISNDAALILGLSYEHFKRTIIIPQGKFKEFLELGAQERTTMVKDIFGLHRFDLKDKTTRLLLEADKEKISIEGNLKAFEDINPDAEAEITAAINQLQIQHSDATKQLQNEQDLLQKMDALAEHWQNLSAYKHRLETLQIQTPSFEKRKADVAIYLKTIAIFKSRVDAFKKLLQDKKQHEAQQQIIQQEIISLKQQQETLAAQEAQLMPKISVLEHQRKEIEDWKRIEELVGNQRKIKHLSDRKIAGSQHILDAKEKLRATEKEVLEVQQRLSALAENPLTFDTVQAISEAYQKIQLSQEHIYNAKQVNANYADKIALIAAQMETLATSVATYQQEFEQQIQVLDLQLDNTHQKLQNVMLQKELQHYATALEEGCACPLCGATEHPQKLVGDNVQQQLEAIDHQKQTLQSKLRTTQQHYDKAKQAHQEIVFLQEQIAVNNTTLQLREKELQQHIAQFNFDGYDALNSSKFEQNKQQYFQEEQEKSALRKKLETLQLQLQNTLKAERKYEEAIQEFDHQIIALKASNQTLLATIQVLNADYYMKSETQTPFAEKIKETEAIIAATLQAQENWLQAQQNVALNISKQEGILASVTDNIAQKQEEITTLEAVIQQALTEHQHESLSEVEQLLAQNLATDSEQTAINEFYQNLHQCQENIDRLLTLIGEQTYDLEHHQQLQHRIAEMKQTYDTSLEKLSKLQQQLESLRLRMAQQKTLLAQHEIIATRTHHLNTLKRVFNGDKFVEYISSTYLRQLCALANERFHRLTRNQLSLSINTDNDFEIIDYLNGGKPRSVKTLSGGQAFQASLSLALALAESVQAKSSQKEQFFFIDEGFGTQDKATINIVFETLQDLRKDHRIVGIISHVEELQEQIVKYLTVVKDEEKGSIIHAF